MQGLELDWTCVNWDASARIAAGGYTATNMGFERPIPSENRFGGNMGADNTELKNGRLPCSDQSRRPWRWRLSARQHC